MINKRIIKIHRTPILHNCNMYYDKIFKGKAKSKTEEYKNEKKKLIFLLFFFNIQATHTAYCTNYYFIEFNFSHCYSLLCRVQFTVYIEILFKMLIIFCFFFFLFLNIQLRDLRTLS